jgi:hypothetical protein
MNFRDKSYKLQGPGLINFRDKILQTSGYLAYKRRGHSLINFRDIFFS